MRSTIDIDIDIYSTYPTCTLCYKEIRVSPKIRELPSGTLDLENFATASQRCVVEWTSFVDNVNKTRWRLL